jgi:SAM-dependent methyltransferase
VINSVLDRVHGGMVFSRRVRVLADRLAPLMPQNAKILDVGCGDGSVGLKVVEQRPDCTLEGIDVLVRPHTAFPVKEFDGEHIPYADRSVDAVMFVDVLHHTKDPTALLIEAARVTNSAVIIKDHLREGALAEETLRFMDWVGNARHGVVLPYNYLNRLQWDAALERAGLRVSTWEENVGLYPRPASWIFDRGLHFVAAFTRA